MEESKCGGNVEHSYAKPIGWRHNRPEPTGEGFVGTSRILKVAWQIIWRSHLRGVGQYWERLHEVRDENLRHSEQSGEVR